MDDHLDPVAELARLLDIHTMLFVRTDPADLLDLDGDLAEEVAALLTAAGYPPGGADLDADLDAALAAWAGVENLEERLVPGPDRPGRARPPTHQRMSPAWPRAGAGLPGVPRLVLTLIVDRQRLSSIAHSHHPIAAPIFGVNVNRLLRRAGRGPAARILDLGCGEGAWAMQALAHYPDGHADGVDVSRYALERAAHAAAERGLADRLTLHERDAGTYVPDGDYDLVLCVGSTHVFDGFAGTLRSAGRHVNADGILLVGEGFWQVPPTARALAALGVKPADHTDLPGLLEIAEEAGWTPVYAHVSDAAEWDDYEWSWVGSLTEWALDNPGHPHAAEARALAREHRDQWLRGYRDVLGFVTMVLRRG